mgnify:CR=1 FL=1
MRQRLVASNERLRRGAQVGDEPFYRQPEMTERIKNKKKVSKLNRQMESLDMNGEKYKNGATFDGVMNYIESVTKTTFEPRMKKEATQMVYKDKVQTRSALTPQ